MSEPINLAAIRRNYLPEMLGAREDRRLACKCQAGGVDAVSIDGDWLHVAGEHFTAAVDEVERLRAPMATELDLAAIRARADGATAGPWKTWAMQVLADPVGNSNLDDGLLIAHTSDPRRGLRTFNAEFIAHARIDVPMLLDEIERLARIVNGYDRTPAEQRAAEAEAEVERLGVLVQSERDAYADLQHEFEVHFGWTVPEGKVCHACHELEVEENSRLLNEAWEDVERLRAENERLREREARRHSKFSQVQPRVSMLEILGCADGEPATLVLSPEIWCDVCGAWHIPTSCSTANGAGEARTDPRAANRPGMALGDTPQAEDAGEVQS